MLCKNGLYESISSGISNWKYIMQLVINTYGSYLQKNGDCFKVKKDEQVFEVSVKKVDGIMITTAAYITTDPIKLALDWVRKKLDNQIDLLTRLRESRTNKSAEITAYIDKLRNCRNSFDSLIPKDARHIGIEDVRGSIMGIEGSGGRIYFEAISFIMPDRYQFYGRSRNPAKDEFNALLNYGYGILYSKVEKACIIAGLAPYVGIIHTDHYNKKSLVFDLIENFRIWADETIINLFAGRKVMQEHFDNLKNGFTLNKDGKALLIESLSKFLDESIRYSGRNIKREDVMQFECHRIANSLIKDAS